MILTETRNIDDVLEAYKNYINFLIPKNPELMEAINNGETVESIAREELETAVEYDDTEILLIKHKNITVGFMIIGQYPNAFLDDSIYVQEFYIEKKWQRKGFGRYAAKLLFLRYPKRPVEMLILKKNKGAIRFWGKIMSRNGYHIVSDSNINETAFSKKGEFCDWLLYEPNRKEDSSC